MPSRGIFFLVAGPAGVGKTTLLRELVAAGTNLVRATSVTTRPPRPGEVDGQSYYFWDEARFKEAAEKGEFLEHAIVHGNHYGTLARFVEEKLDSGQDIVKDIDVQGVALLRRNEKYRYPRSVAVFVVPPSREELVRRITSRASDARDSITRRLEAAEKEMARIGEFDYVVVNDSLEHGLKELQAIVLAEHCRGRKLQF